MIVGGYLYKFDLCDCQCYLLFKEKLTLEKLEEMGLSAVDALGLTPEDVKEEVESGRVHCVLLNVLPCYRPEKWGEFIRLDKVLEEYLGKPIRISIEEVELG